MPKFRVKSETSEVVEPYEELLEFPHIKAATDDAQVALAEMAREILPNGKRANIRVSVENDVGKELFRAGLSFSCQDEGDLDRECKACDAAADDVASHLASGLRE